MEIECFAEILQDGHLSIDPKVAKEFKQGERIKVRISRIEQGATSGVISDQAQQLLKLFENAPARGGFSGREVSREFIHEQ